MLAFCEHLDSVSTFGKVKDLSESSYDSIRLVPQTVKLAVSIFLLLILPAPPNSKFSVYGEGDCHTLHRKDY